MSSDHCHRLLPHHRGKQQTRQFCPKCSQVGGITAQALGSKDIIPELVRLVGVMIFRWVSIKKWSSTQAMVALSSVEPQYISLVRAASGGLGA